MSFVRFRGKTKLMYFKKGDTTRGLRNGGLVQLDSGLLHHGPGGDSTDKPIGVCRLDVTSITDTSSWQGAPMVPVEVPVELGVEWLIDVDSDGGATDTDIGAYCAMDTITDSLFATRADVSDTTTREIFITGRQSATRIIGVIARNALISPRSLDTVDTGP